jgi:hypothetical protein
MSIKDRLNNTTGIQRVFLVSLVICWGYFALVQSFTEAVKINKSNLDFRLAIYEDYKNPACLPFTTNPLNQLKEPPYKSGGGSCWHLYTYRVTAKDLPLPFTEEKYDDKKFAEHWRNIFEYLLIYSIAVFLGFFVIFIVYKVGVWVLSGFKKKND